MRNFRYHLIITLLVVSLLLSGCGPVEEPVNYVPEGYDEHMPPDLEQTIKKAMEEEGKVFVFEKYYGTYGDCVVWFAGGISCAFMTKEIAGYKFIYPSSFTIDVYRNGQILPLEEAYQKRWLSKNQIKLLAEYHAAATEWQYSANNPPASDPPASEPPASKPTATDPPPTTTEPVDTELEIFNELFRWSEERNPYNHAMRVMYDFASPEELYLRSFYDGGLDGEHEITDEDWAEYSKMVADPENVHGDFNRLPKDKIEAELQAVFGISLADLSDRSFRGLFYLECSDSYCFNQGGVASKRTNGGFQDIIHNDDGTVSLIYEDQDGKCAITLKPNGDSYLVVSNIHIK